MMPDEISKIYDTKEKDTATVIRSNKIKKKTAQQSIGKK